MQLKLNMNLWYRMRTYKIDLSGPLRDSKARLHALKIIILYFLSYRALFLQSVCKVTALYIEIIFRSPFKSKSISTPIQWIQQGSEVYTFQWQSDEMFAHNVPAPFPRAPSLSRNLFLHVCFHFYVSVTL